MDTFLNKNASSKINPNTSIEISSTTNNDIEKTITANDIRARIVSIPSSIIKQFTDDMSHVNVIVNKNSNYNFKINRGRNYFTGVTEFLREYNFISDDGVITSKQTNWYYNSDAKTVNIIIYN